MAVAIVFDLTEKLDDFFENQAPLSEIIVDYYIPFIPYYMNMFSSLFIFISVIFFTSRMAGNSEIIAMLASGMSYHRILRPYWISATFLFALFWSLGGFVIPRATSRMLHFEDKYIRQFTTNYAQNVQMQVEPGLILYIESFMNQSNMGYRSSLEHFDGKSLRSRIVAERIRYAGTAENPYLWQLEDYTRREFDGLQENISTGTKLDTTLRVKPQELFITAEHAAEMTNAELYNYIQKQRARGTGNIKAFQTELHKRWASPLGAFIMTLLAVTLSSRKVRGGTGKNMAVGFSLTAIYILFSAISTTFAVTGALSPFLAVWLPNFIFLSIGIYLYRQEAK